MRYYKVHKFICRVLKLEVQNFKYTSINFLNFKVKVLNVLISEFKR